MGAANADTGRVSADASAAGRQLKQRIVSGIVLAAGAVAAIWIGFPVFDLMVFAASILAAFEWRRLCDLQADKTSWGLLVGALSVPLVHVIGTPATLLFVSGVALMAVVVAALLKGKLVWLGLGIVYLGIPATLLIDIRLSPEQGTAQVFWLVAVVIATDIGAYVGGHAIGGPRMAPRISPGKTWAGAVSGALAATLSGLLVIALFQGELRLVAALLAGFVSVAAQLGDLLESAVKRHWGQKDSGTLIPGHGGILDRIDGLLLAAPAFALLSFLGLFPI